MSLKYKSTILLLLAGGVLLLDRITKMMVVDRMRLSDSISVIGGCFDITHVRNTGAAFGIMALADDSYRVPFFLVTTTLAVCLLTYFIFKARDDEKLMMIGLSLILGGALGNLADRALYGYVIDFIDWHIGEHHWPAFNIADSGITIGVFLLGIEMIFVKSKTEEKP